MPTPCKDRGGGGAAEAAQQCTSWLAWGQSALLSGRSVAPRAGHGCSGTNLPQPQRPSQAAGHHIYSMASIPACPPSRPHSLAASAAPARPPSPAHPAKEKGGKQAALGWQLLAVGGRAVRGPQARGLAAAASRRLGGMSKGRHDPEQRHARAVGRRQRNSSNTARLLALHTPQPAANDRAGLINKQRLKPAPPDRQ